MAIKVNGTTVINDSRALQNVASVDATTAASMTAAGVGASPTKTWDNIGTINYGNRSSSVSVSEYWTLPSKYQDGFEGDVMVYGTATSINQTSNGDSQQAYVYFGDHSFISTGNGTDLLLWKPNIDYAWYNGGSRDVTNVKFWFSKKLIVSSGATFFSSSTGPSGLEINGSGWAGDTSFTGEAPNLQSTYRNAQKFSSSNGNGFNLRDINAGRTNWIPYGNSSWNRRIYSDLKTEQLSFTGFTLTLYINSNL